MAAKPKVHAPETVPLDGLAAHPRNYRRHPDDQLAHLERSIREHGFYRNVIVAKDGTILAGHGVVEAASRAGIREIPVVRLPIAPESPQALRILTGDNELMRLAEVDDRLLTCVSRACVYARILPSDGSQDTGVGGERATAPVAGAGRGSADAPSESAAW